MVFACCSLLTTFCLLFFACNFLVVIFCMFLITLDYVCLLIVTFALVIPLRVLLQLCSLCSNKFQIGVIALRCCQPKKMSMIKKIFFPCTELFWLNYVVLLRYFISYFLRLLSITIFFLKSTLCDYNDEYILVSGSIKNTRAGRDAALSRWNK